MSYKTSINKKDHKDLESVPCILCGNEDLKNISNKGQFGLPCNVSICPNDGLVFLTPRWLKERYRKFYINEYGHYYRPKILKEETEEQKYSSIRQICSRIESVSSLINKTSVLDIRSGMGRSLEWLKSHYSNFSRFLAIESSKYCSNHLLNKIKAEVIGSDIDSDWYKSDVELVIMRHVLEHFLNPIEALKKVYNSMAEDGIAYIAVPDMMHPARSLSHYWFRGVHVFYHSASTLTKVAAIANLTPITIKSENSELFGIFKKSQNSNINAGNFNIYKSQLRVIRQHRIKSIYFDIKYLIKRILSAILTKM